MEKWNGKEQLKKRPSYRRLYVISKFFSLFWCCQLLLHPSVSPLEIDFEGQLVNYEYSLITGKEHDFFPYRSLTKTCLITWPGILYQLGQ